ncbi:MAG TPA: helix-turn-helix domain-containing protein [Terriglobia bacterium]|nr:helix-turn-helix domain-containing protein [Terriglobia bacterium]
MSRSLKESVDAFEKDLLQDALKSAAGSRARAARLLQTSERIFNHKVRKHGINPE